MKISVRFFVIIMALISSICTVDADAGSLSVSPPILLLESTKPTATLRLVNRSAESTTVQLEVMRWTQDAEGENIYEPTKDIVFFPKIIEIEAEKEQIIRVGSQITLKEIEQAYRIFIRELPVKKPSQEGALKMLLNLSMPLFLRPENPEPVLNIEQTTLVDNLLSVAIHNSGNSYFKVGTLTASGIDDSGKSAFSAETQGWYVLPGITKHFSLEIPDEGCRASKTINAVVEAEDRVLREEFTVQLEPNSCR